MLAASLGGIGHEVLTPSPFAGFDVSFYRCYALGFWQGEEAAHGATDRVCAPIWTAVPRRFHTLPREYPGPALIIFSLPLLLPWLPYPTAYALWLGLCMLVTATLLAWRGPPQAALAFPLYVFVAGWGFVLGRYDLIVGLCIMLAVVLARRGMLLAAHGVLGVGTLLKIVPLVLVPVMSIAARRNDQGRWRFDLVALVAVIGLLGMVGVWALDPAALWGPLSFALARPLHIESLAGSLLWATSGAPSAVGGAAGGGVVVAFSYNSLNVEGGAQAFWAVACAAGGGAAIALATWRAWRGQDSPGRSVVLILSALLVAGKVFSPQYVLWLLPVAALVEGLRLRWLLLAALGGMITYCYQTIPLSDLPWSPLFITTILARNLLVCGVVVLYLAMPGDRVNEGWPARPLWQTLRIWAR